MQAGETDVPGRLAAAMLPGDLIKATFKRAAESEVVGVEGEDLIGLDGAPQPFGEGDLAMHEPPVGVMFALEVGGVEEREDLRVHHVAGGNVRLDDAACEAEKRPFKSLVILSALVPVGKAKHLGAVDDDTAGDGLAKVPAMHDVADCVDENVLVEDGGHAEARGSDLDLVAVVVAVAADRPVGEGGKGEERVLEMLLHVLEADAGDVDGEERGRGVALRAERLVEGHDETCSGIR